jgi:hypothetical protein
MISLDTIRSLRPSRRGWITLAVAGVIITGTSTAVAFTQLNTSTAEDTPVEIKVEDHEQRLTKKGLPRLQLTSGVERFRPRVRSG